MYLYNLTRKSTYAKFATVVRSIKLLFSFRLEKTQPKRFYEILAEDTFQSLAKIYYDSCGELLANKTVLDVGGGPGFFQPIFTKNDCNYCSVDLDKKEILAAGIPPVNTIQASGYQLPFRSASVDVCFASNVAEHVKEPWRLADEMLRVVKPGGLMMFSYTLWYGPFGGHEMGLTHYLGARRAVKIYHSKHGRLPKNLYGVSLFKLTAAAGIAWARIKQHDSRFKVIATIPRYTPWWSWWIMKVPGIREFFGSNLMIIIKAV